VIGIGTDLVELDRFRLALSRTPRIAERLFSDAERAYAARRADPTERLAARFAAKEAVMKAMGVGLWKFPLRDVEVVKAPSGQPSVLLHGRAAALAEERGVREWRLTLTHTDRIAQAIAVAL
jgi:holo-[acyl-carrier protein] synthase